MKGKEKKTTVPAGYAVLIMAQFRIVVNSSH